MSHHRFDPDSAVSLEDTSRFRFLSRDELISALDASPDARIADLGSGTGFYTREIAPFVETVYAVDVQWEMHEAFADEGIPENVTRVYADAAELPFEDDSLAAIYSTMTYHEYDSRAVSETYRALSAGGRLVIVDWSAEGRGERGPPLDVRTDSSTVATEISTAGFEVDRVKSRPETLLVAGTKA